MQNVGIMPMKSIKRQMAGIFVPALRAFVFALFELIYCF